MKRGEIWTVAGGPDYTGKPRPALIVQDDAFGNIGSVTLCTFTTTELSLAARELEPLRPEVKPSAANGLASSSFVMVDKISTVSESKLGRRIGELAADEMATVDGAILIFLGLARQ